MKNHTLASWRDFSEHRASALSLLAANALPLLGVLLWGWSLFTVVVIYWAENVVIGLINILKLISCGSSVVESKDFPYKRGAKFFCVPFFTVHYGIFCLVHGVFVFVLLGVEEGGHGGPLGDWPEPFELLRETGGLWAIVGLAMSHFFSFVRNYLVGGEYQRVSLTALMIQPYGRIIVLHLAIIFGAFAIFFLGGPIWLLVILIVGKTALDLALHLREHQNGSDDQRHDGDDGQDRGDEGFGAGA